VSFIAWYLSLTSTGYQYGENQVVRSSCASRSSSEQLTDDDKQKNLKWVVVGQRGARRLIKTQARGEQGWREQRTSGASGTRQREQQRPATGRQPTLQGPQLLPSRKRTRSWRAAQHRAEEGDEAEDETEEEEATEDETRSPASKK
jgi:hypothetical protein